MSTFRSTSRSAAVVPRHFAFRRGCIVVSGGLALLIGGGTLPTTARAAGLPVTTPNRKEPVRFGDEIVPLLAANCTACHNKTLAEGGLSMESLATMQKGGDSGPAIAAGKPAESVLFQRASHRQGDAMPPADNKVGAKNLTPEQLGLLERWIAEGAGGSEIVAKPINWRPPPKGIGGVIAVAMSADGQLTAAARGGRLTVFDTQSGTSLATLVDPALAGSGPDLAHADIISSAAFSPAEDMLATGSYRTIKFWKRAGVRKFADVAGSAGATGAVAARAGSPVAVPLADGRVAIVDTSAAAPALVRTVGAAGPAAVAVAISADGAVVAVAGQDKAVSLWQVADGAAAGRFTRPADIRSLTFAAGGKRLVTAEADGVLRVWESPVAGGDPAAVKPIKEIPGAAHPVVGLAELPAAAPPAAAGQPPATARAAIVVGGCGDGAVKLWNIDTGAMVRQVAHGGAVAGVAVSPDGSVIASVGAVPGVKLWKAADGAAIAHTTGDFRIAERLARKDADIAVLKRDVEHAKAEVAAAEKGKKAAADEIKKATDKLAAAEKNLKEKETPFLAGKMAREDAEKQAAAATMAVTQAEAAVAAATKGVEALPSGADAAAKAGPEQALAKARRDLDMAKAKAAPLVAAVTAKTEA
jgi:WD40 repeat protein